MYARSTTIRGNPQNMDEGMAYVRDTVMPAVQQMDGCVGLSMLVDRDSGRCIVTTSWADHQAMMNSAEGVRAMRDRGVEIFGGEADVAEWEIAVLHRVSETGDGACCRVIWTQCEPAELEGMLDAFRMSMIQRIEELPGFCSCSVMVDRYTGRCATAVTYESRDAMDRANEQGVAMREEFTRQMGIQVTDVKGFDLALAHLRVPETV